MANILLITYFFPPSNSAASRRSYSWAKYLRELGHNVVVLTVDIADGSTVSKFEADLSSLNVYRTKFFDLRKTIYKLFNIKRPLSDSLIEVKRKGWYISFLKNLFDWFTINLIERGCLYGVARLPSFVDQWFFNTYKEAKRIVEQYEINLVITTSPPPVAHIVGICLKRKFKDLLFFVDFQDLWVQNPWQKGCFPFTLVESFLEAKCINSADVVTVVSEVWMQWLKNRYPQISSKIFCIENGFDMYFANATKCGGVKTPKSKKTIIYTGTLYNKRGTLEPLFTAVNSNYSNFIDKLEIIFYGPYETKRILDKFFNKYPYVNEVIKYGGFLSAKEIFYEQDKADVLLFIEKDQLGDGMLTSKIYEYIMFEKPILCVGISSSSYLGSFLERTGLGIFCGDDVDKINNGLNTVIAEEIKVYPNEDYIQNFSRKKQVERVDRIIRVVSSVK